MPTRRERRIDRIQKTGKLRGRHGAYLAREGHDRAVRTVHACRNALGKNKMIDRPNPLLVAEFACENALVQALRDDAVEPRQPFAQHAEGLAHYGPHLFVRKVPRVLIRVIRVARDRLAQETQVIHHGEAFAQRMPKTIE